MPLIETKRLILRQWKESDKAPFASLNADGEVMEFLPKLLTPEESDAMADRHAKNIDNLGYGFFAVDVKDSDQFIGFVGLADATFEAHFTPAVEIGWRLARNAWGQGYATEAAKACLEFGFRKLKLSEIVSFTTIANKRSQRVMQKAGMVYSGTFERTVLPEGHPLRPHVLYSITKNDWEKRLNISNR